MPAKKKQKQNNNKDADFVPEEHDGMDKEPQDESEHTEVVSIQDQSSPTPSMVNNQILRLQIWLLHSTFGHMNPEIQARKLFGYQIQAKHAQALLNF